MTWNHYQQDECARLAAALAYYTLFSCVPLVLLLVSVVGLIAQNPTVEQQMLEQALNLLGPAAASGVRALIVASRHQGQGIVATIFGLLTMAWGATSLVSQLQASLNQIWRVRVRTDLGWRAGLLRRLRLLMLVFSGGALLILSQLASTVLTALHTLTGNISAFWPALEESLSLLVLVALFTGVFAILPDVKLRPRQVFPGAMLTAVLFLVGRWAINLYLSGGALSTTYGAAASLVILLLWCNYSAQIVFLGAEFTKVCILQEGEVQAGSQGEKLAG